jgi:hypothetical protein
MKQINELRDPNNFSKIDSMSSEEVREWYHTIKNSLDILSRHFSENEINSIKFALSEYERKHGLS